jgi:uncharacterized protein YdaL
MKSMNGEIEESSEKISLLEGHTPSFPSTGAVIFTFDISTCCILTLAGVTASRKVYIPIPQAARKTQFKVNQMVGNKIAQKQRMPKLYTKPKVTDPQRSVCFIREDGKIILVRINANIYAKEYDM